MTKRLLIDAAHPEEVQVALIDDHRLEEFDFESTHKKQIKGNIYLAKVTRVEPSLQAAFVEYGGNRQGFLPFSEIHYDYFNIPIDDKKAIEEAEIEAASKTGDVDEDVDAEAPAEEEVAEEASEEAEEEASADSDADEVVKKPRRQNDLYRRYKIQEVIKRNQIVLIQVIKEERGNKGASLTTSISLPGRYCVFMPNTSKQGGVSRRIASLDDRKRLRKIVDDLDVEAKSSVIIRTAGAERTKAEVKRDYQYLSQLWNDIRELTVSSEAPSLIYEEGDLIKRSLRDIYNNDVDEVIVDGEGGMKVAKKFMKTIAPSHLRKIKEHKDTADLFSKYGIEDELNKLYESEIPLESGGYLVINPTEALVSIDVNSGKATKERNIEETAVKTNLEAAREIARQLRLRDLAGLVVIDFIDMLQLKNKKAIERSLKDALKSDRARIQVGRISNFGLLEMSRQRLRASITESSTSTCPMCKGTGKIRSASSNALSQLRAIERAASTTKRKEVMCKSSMEAAIYLLNNKRDEIIEIENHYDVSIHIEGDLHLLGSEFTIDGEKLFGLPSEEKPDRKRQSRSRGKGGNRRNNKSRDQKRKVSFDSVSGIDANDEITEEADDASDEVSEEKPKKSADTNKDQKDDAPKKRGRSKKADTKKDPANENGPEDLEITPGTEPTAEEKSALKGLWNKITN